MYVWPAHSATFSTQNQQPWWVYHVDEGYGHGYCHILTEMKYNFCVYCEGREFDVNDMIVERA